MKKTNATTAWKVIGGSGLLLGAVLAYQVSKNPNETVCAEANQRYSKEIANTATNAAAAGNTEDSLAHARAVNEAGLKKLQQMRCSAG